MTKTEKKIVPEVLILHGDKETGVRIYRSEGGKFEAKAEGDIRGILPVVEAVIADLIELKAEFQPLVNALNEIEAKRIAREEREARDKYGA